MMDAKLKLTVPASAQGVHLSVMCPDSLSTEEIEILQKLFKKATEDIRDAFKDHDMHVSWHFEQFLSSVLWYIVLHRPLKFEHETPLLRNGTTIRELASNARAAIELNRIDMGVVLDPAQQMLSLLWLEAQKSGVLSGIERIPLWRSVVMATECCSEAALAKFTPERWEQLARVAATRTAFRISEASVRKKGSYFRDKLYWVSKEEKRKIIFYDLRGVDVPKAEVIEEYRSQTCLNDVRAEDVLDADLSKFSTRRGALVRLNVDSAEEYFETKSKYRHRFRNTERYKRKKDEYKGNREHKRAKRAFGLKPSSKFTAQAGREVTRNVYEVARMMGHTTKGRWLTYLPLKDALRILELCCKRAIAAFDLGPKRSPSGKLIYEDNLHTRELLGPDLMPDGSICDTKALLEWSWTENRRDQVRQTLSHLEELVVEWALPLEYSIWLTLKNVGREMDDVLQWAYETLEDIAKLRKTGKRTTKGGSRGVEEKEGREQRGRGAGSRGAGANRNGRRH